MEPLLIQKMFFCCFFCSRKKRHEMIKGFPGKIINVLFFVLSALISPPVVFLRVAPCFCPCLSLGVCRLWRFLSSAVAWALGLSSCTSAPIRYLLDLQVTLYTSWTLPLSRYLPVTHRPISFLLFLPVFRLFPVITGKHWSCCLGALSQVLVLQSVYMFH